MPFLGASWRTSLSGLIAGFTVLAGQIQTLLDNDPSTNPEYTIVVGTISAMIAVLQVRDNNVTSEQAKAKK
jgi:hypothetical protein